MSIHVALHGIDDAGYRPGRTADVVLYLDLDGVVHHEAVYWHPNRGAYMHPILGRGHQLFEWLQFLEDALLPYPDIALVLSSSWCIRPGYGKTLRRFPPGLRARFIGGTFHRRVHGLDPWATMSFRMNSRADQILSDIARRRPLQWLALDDDVDVWPERYLANLVACDGKTGLSAPRVQAELAQKLRTSLLAVESSRIPTRGTL